MKVLLSIKPVFVERIFDGTKKYEFRKAIFKNPDVGTVVVYASSPVQRVIGEFDIERILSADPKALWAKTKKHAGISEEFFFRYFSRREFGYAIQVKETRRYKKARCLRTHYNVTPPQSYRYVAE